MKVKNQTYMSAKLRILPFSRYYHGVFSYIMIPVMLFLFLGGIKFESESWFITIFIIIWLFLVTNIGLLFWKTRDFIALINTPGLQFPRMVLGPKRSKDPFQVVKEILPHYLKCVNCDDPVISQKRFGWEFHDSCRKCGYDNATTKG